jgi:hypothetical protein
VALLVAYAWPAAASEVRLTTTNFNNYGVPSGLIDMPTAEMAPDGEISVTVAHFEGYTRNTVTFQLAPWITGSFRYIGIDDLTPLFDIYYDRSFDFRIRLIEESEFLPGIAVGMQDFLGTGVLSSEYIVATKQIGNRLRVTGGVGWGRLGSYNSFATIGSRPAFSFAGVGTGGNFRISDYFNGDMALFGGFSYQLTDKISLSAEYSSDNYDFENQQGVFVRKTPWNLGATYKADENFVFRIFSVHGQEIGASVTLTLNPKKPPTETQGPAPLPIAVRSPESINDLGWSLDPNQSNAFEIGMKTFLDKENIEFEGLQLTARSAHVRIRNRTYLAEAQALGRTFRVMSRLLPGSIETFHITVVNNGMSLMTTSIRRSDLERLEYEKEDQALLATTFSDSLRFGNVPEPAAGLYPNFTWSLAPILRYSIFDPDNPFRADIRIRARGTLDLGNGWHLNGTTSVRLLGNLKDINRASNSLLPHVRNPIAGYNYRFGPTIDQLTVTKFARIAPDWYGRFTAGYLEIMYAGASGEVMWKPVDSRLALGMEVNYVHLRNSDQRFGLASHTTPGGTIPHWNGHMSAYYQFNGGYTANVHAGRYLAGDWGATLEVARTFNNGWVIGAFATKTNVSAEQFGEGSFDKGLFFNIPFSWVIGNEGKQGYANSIRPIQRDGGQRVGVPGRLYGVISEPHRPNVAKSWGRFWK